MEKQFFTFFCAIFFAGNLFGQNCGTLSAFSYTTSTSSTSGNTIYTFAISALSTSNGDKSLNLTVSIGANTVISKCYVSAPSNAAANTYTEGPFDVPSGTVDISWTGWTNTVCGGSQCLSGTTALPVELIKFSAKAIDSHNLLLWTTASESNNIGFEIEQSSNSTDWQNIGWVDGHGTSNTVHNYEYADLTPAPLSYYRLKQIDYDGEFEYSVPTVVKRKVEGNLVIYPNPTMDIIHLSNHIIGYKIYTIFGTLIEVSNHVDKSIDLIHLPNGLYLLETTSDHNIINTQKVSIEK